MAELTNPLFENEKEFLERQKLEYERALLGDVDNIKEKTQQASKVALIGAGVVGGIWLLAKAFRSKKSSRYEEDEESTIHRLKAKSRKGKKGRLSARHSEVDTAVADDFGFGGYAQGYRGFPGNTHERAHLAPEVYHTDAGDTDPFPPLPYDDARRLPKSSFAASSSRRAPEPKQPSLIAASFHTFLESETGKLLMAQVTAVLMAYVAKKVGEYMPMVKNSDLASPAPHSTAEPEIKDIEFTFHDDGDAPLKPL